MPRAAPFMKTGMLSERANSIAASAPRAVHTWVPRSTHGFFAFVRMSARRSTEAGSPMLLVDARYWPGCGRTAFSSGTCASRMSRPISRYAGPGAPASASRKAIEHMSATRSVVTTLEANFVIGRMMSTWGRSCREPMRCWLSAPWPPISSIGLSARNALATPVMASVVPGPAVTTAQPGRPVTRA